MKRTPLRRKTRLTATSSPRTSRKPSAYKQRERDFPYMGWIKRQPCCAAHLGGCSGPIEADHAGRRGIARKADDRTCIGICRLHHRQRHDFSGPFKAWNKQEMRLWLLSQVDAHQQRYALSGAGGG